MKLTAIVCTAFLTFCLTTCAQTNKQKKVLVAYFSAHRQQSLVLSGIFLLQPELVPVVAFIIDRCSHGL